MVIKLTVLGAAYEHRLLDITIFIEQIKATLNTDIISFIPLHPGSYHLIELLDLTTSHDGKTPYKFTVTLAGMYLTTFSGTNPILGHKW